MSRFAFRAVLAFAAIGAAFGLSRSAQADEYRIINSNDLFYNYYAGQNGGQPAQMYISPVPTPPWVGHTYVTYQPFYPQEYLYRHHRTYRTDQYNGSTTWTCVHWW